MNKQDVILKLKELIIDCLDLDLTTDQIQGTNLVSELGITSIHAMKILLTLEDAFDIEIGYGDLNLDLIKSLDSLTDYILEQQSN